MKLVKGSGSPETGACWMSAIYFYTRVDKTTWSDHPECVSPMIRTLCIRLNDALDDGERERFIGRHLFTPIGTNTGIEDDKKRAFLCADRAVRVFAPLALDARGYHEHAKKLRELPPIVDRESALAGRAAANAANAAAYAAGAAHAAYAATGAAAHAAGAAAGAAADAAADAAYAKQEYKNQLLQLILDCCAIGEPVDVKKSCAKDEVLDFIGATKEERELIYVRP